MYQYRGTNYKIHTFFFFLYNYGTVFFQKWNKRFKLYLYIKWGFWVGLAQLWFSSLYRIGKLWGVCAFVWKRVCVCVLENQLFVIYAICMVQNTGLSLSRLFLSGIGWGCALTWHVIGLEGQWNILQVLIRCILLQTFFFIFFGFLCRLSRLPSTKHK